MAAADVEAVCRWMWAHCYPLLENLADGFTDALQEEKITRIAAASAEQKNLLRGIRAALAADHVSAERIEELDAAVAHAGKGPLYFNVVVMMYEQWADEYRAYLSSLGSPMASTPGSCEGEGSDEDLRGMHTGARQTGVVRVGGGQGARMSALLAALGRV